MTHIGTSPDPAITYLQEGRVVAIPTETVYGLAALCTQPHAISEVFRIKNRPTSHPLILHSFSLEDAQPWLGEVPQWAHILAETFWPGPLTILLPKHSDLDPQITASLSTVALRIPSHPLTRALLSRLKTPFVAPSANLYGHLSPTCAAHVEKQLGSKISYILDGGEAQIGIESTIVGCEGTQIVVYREGALPIEQLEKALAQRIYAPKDRIRTPGSDLRHYSPGTPLWLGDTKNLLSQISSAEEIALLRFSTPYPSFPIERQSILSKSGSLTEATHSLFSTLHFLDTHHFSLILAEPVPDTGLGKSINDRLRRAAHRIDL